MPTVADGTYLDRILSFVKDRDTFQALEEGAARVEAVARRLGPTGLARPYGPGKWTGIQVLAHLADAELATGFRTRQVLTLGEHTVQEYDETAWIGLYSALDAEVVLQAFLATRRLNLQAFRGLTPTQLARVGHHPKRGPEAVALTLRSLAGHTFNHLAQLESL